jgi:23S rRNA pseudouridine1911/1915/1917 synthase
MLRIIAAGWPTHCSAESPPADPVVAAASKLRTRGDATFLAPAAAEPRPLDRVLRALLQESWGRVRGLIQGGKVRVDGEIVVEPTLRVRAGARIELARAAPAPARESLARGALVYVDTHVVVVEKPAGVSSVPYSDERGTLDELVRTALKRGGRTARSDTPLGVVHRLDKETSGLIVYCRTLAAKRHLAMQFRRHSVQRRYLALTHGAVRPATIRTRLVSDRGDGLRGSTSNPKLGRPAVTHVAVVESLPRATLVACRLETGRTHQIRIHLAERGHPLLGERVYVRNFLGDTIPAPRLMLHAARLGFEHPVTGAWLEYESPLPSDFRSVLERLRTERDERDGPR